MKTIPGENAELILDRDPEPSDVQSVLPPASLRVFDFNVAPVGTVTASPAAPKVTVVPDNGSIFLVSRVLMILIVRKV
jgi:hypothetical protein